MKKRSLAVFVLALVCAAPSLAAEKNAPATSGPGDAQMDRPIPTESQQPMNMNEPMPIGMARKGMKKGDVKAHAMKKEAAMDEMMKREEMRR